MNATEINGKLFKAKADKITVYPVRHLRASNLGHPCERYLFLLIKHWDEQKAHDVGLQNIFDLGNTLEDHTIKNIKEAGYEVITPTQRRLNAFILHWKPIQCLKRQTTYHTAKTVRWRTYAAVAAGNRQTLTLMTNLMH